MTLALEMFAIAPAYGTANLAATQIALLVGKARWIYDAARGWMWTPDTTWGPAWVQWRTGPDFVAWIPLAPRSLA